MAHFALRKPGWTVKLPFLFSLGSSQEVTQKILDAVGNIAGSSLEQTSWLSRNLEVKAQPQISLEESDAEEDLHGRYIYGSESNACCQLAGLSLR